MLGTSLLWRSTVAFTYLKVKSAKCLCLLPAVLVLLIWSWSCKQWSWSCYFGLGLKNLVLFTSLITPDLQDQDRSFWSQTGLVLRPTFSDHITAIHIFQCVNILAKTHLVRHYVAAEILVVLYTMSVKFATYALLLEWCW